MSDTRTSSAEHGEPRRGAHHRNPHSRSDRDDDLGRQSAIQLRFGSETIADYTLGDA